MNDDMKAAIEDAMERIVSKNNAMAFPNLGRGVPSVVDSTAKRWSPTGSDPAPSYVAEVSVTAAEVMRANGVGTMFQRATDILEKAFGTIDTSTMWYDHQSCTYRAKLAAHKSPIGTIVAKNASGTRLHSGQPAYFDDKTGTFADKTGSYGAVTTQPGDWDGVLPPPTPRIVSVSDRTVLQYVGLPDGMTSEERARAILEEQYGPIRGYTLRYEYTSRMYMAELEAPTTHEPKVIRTEFKGQDLMDVLFDALLFRVGGEAAFSRDELHEAADRLKRGMESTSWDGFGDIRVKTGIPVSEFELEGVDV
jgi:hypothetical protein